MSYRKPTIEEKIGGLFVGAFLGFVATACLTWWLFARFGHKL
jgi:hypothetical protein